MAFVLLVEDEDQVRVLAESYLEEQGHAVLTAASKDGALAILQSDQAIDLLFVDLGLKDEIDGGIELAKLAVEIRPKLKVLYTTGRPVTDGTRARFVEGSALLPKPYTVEQLITSLSVHFRISPQPRR
ncbi:MAG TPA: response regulator [Xanthobacteraceae bacterium]|nr:response regulator [Xanthobacteraceae bacterium]